MWYKIYKGSQSLKNGQDPNENHVVPKSNKKDPKEKSAFAITLIFPYHDSIKTVYIIKYYYT